MTRYEDGHYTEEPDPAERAEVPTSRYAAPALDPAPPAGRTRSSPTPPSAVATLRAWLSERVGAGLRGQTLDPGRAGVRLLVTVSVFAAVVATTFLWRARPAVEPAPTAASPRSLVSLTPSATPSARTVVVHVGGKVREPGVFTLPAGSRVIDAVKVAGGVQDGADTGRLNLARPLVDGEQIVVGVPAPAGMPVPGSGGTARPLNLNLATAEQLEELPGVGPVLAGRIVEYRTRNGGFRSVEQLKEVSGIGPKTFADIEDRVRA